MTAEQAEDLVREATPYYWGVAKSIGKHYPQHMHDMVQEGMLAYWKFLNTNYDPTKNDHPQKAAHLRIRGAMVDYLRKLHGRTRHSGKWYQTVSINRCFKMAMPIPFDFTELPTAWARTLNSRELKIMQMIFFDEMLEKEVAQFFGVTEPRINQIKRKVLIRIRENFSIQ